MKVKKLSKSEVEEGLTPEMVNNLPLDRNLSPVQLHKGDEPVEVMACSAGFWIMYEPGQFLKDKDNKLIVYTVKQIRIARARYLLNYGEAEKTKKVDALISDWKKQIWEKIEIGKKKIIELRKIRDAGEDNINAISPDHWEKQKQEAKEKLEAFEPQILEIEEAYNRGEIIELLELLNIRKFNNPMLTAKIDNSKDMQVVKNTFGADALSKWGGDMLRMYANIEIEKQYV